MGRTIAGAQRLRDRRVLVTGAASGIGRSVTLRLLAEGAHAAAAGIAEDGLATTQGLAAHPASKGGIAAFTHSLALEYAGRGLRGVSIVPGGIRM